MREGGPARGLRLDDLMLAQLFEGAPYALGMVERLRRDHGLHHEPANIFSFRPPGWANPRQERETA